MLNDPTPYFSINHAFKAYISPWEASLPLPSEADLQRLLPADLQLINNVKSLEADCLVQLKQFDDNAKTISNYLKLQSQKIDLILQHILEKEQHTGDECIGSHFGGSGITITTSTPLQENSHQLVTLIIKDELIAILCLAQVSSCTSIDAQVNPQYAVILDFKVISETDVEQLVKASLTLQQKQLKQQNQPL